MRIRIGNAESLTTPENFKLVTDDRQTIIPTESGNVIQDYGHIASGDKITLTAIFSRTEFLKLWQHYELREKVQFTDSAGVEWPGMRVRILSYGYREKFENYITCELELWRI